mmetsp:Transcript_17593/g.25047  ORF Transcript_17593/g.25047 Transcript_17593/m.25047 type:complete len:202 (+) Transcript_17593:384-989(+)|eukprot:CAMPEP_0172430828 /NCGR_PEP_ID=MMETSP1064-20121228/56196_1 /TAXON_ID=202472 /ORGANISM="Aulacoseira subarctica , Strain CCAP 1002/5" /LENGTH=201 /DNA_ID=CAMNT_0013177189 /DNA_START=71 /DNA_END=676 /DNA_ORIENTATION=-
MKGRHNTNLYQLDFSVQSSGKTFGITKRKIKFDFGFVDLQALEQGGVGVECRGEEHQVLFIWSVASGKTRVLLDGKELHHSIVPSPGGFQGKMEFNFNFGKHHIIKLVAHAAPPVGLDCDGFEQRQFDLFLDGLSFFDFARLFELGRGKTASIGHSNIRALGQEEIRKLAVGKQARPLAIAPRNEGYGQQQQAFSSSQFVY